MDLVQMERIGRIELEGENQNMIQNSTDTVGIVGYAESHLVIAVAATAMAKPREIILVRWCGRIMRG